MTEQCEECGGLVVPGGQAPERLVTATIHPAWPGIQIPMGYAECDRVCIDCGLVTFDGAWQRG